MHIWVCMYVCAYVYMHTVFVLTFTKYAYGVNGTFKKYCQRLAQNQCYLLLKSYLIINIKM